MENFIFCAVTPLEVNLIDREETIIEIILYPKQFDILPTIKNDRSFNLYGFN